MVMIDTTSPMYRQKQNMVDPFFQTGCRRWAMGRFDGADGGPRGDSNGDCLPAIRNRDG